MRGERVTSLAGNKGTNTRKEVIATIINVIQVVESVFRSWTRDFEEDREARRFGSDEFQSSAHPIAVEPFLIHPALTFSPPTTSSLEGHGPQDIGRGKKNRQALRMRRGQMLVGVKDSSL
jgi:hypothetical protein